MLEFRPRDVKDLFRRGGVPRIAIIHLSTMYRIIYGPIFVVFVLVRILIDLVEVFLASVITTQVLQHEGTPLSLFLR